MGGLKRFFSYYGGKWRLAPHYPKPQHKTIIEPFAGSAGYSVRHHCRQVILYDVDPIIAGVWDYLIKSTPEDIYRLPVHVDDVDHLKVCQEAKWLIGFWVGMARSMPGKIPTSFNWLREGDGVAGWGQTVIDRIASQVPYIKHWQIHNASYDKVPNQEATWFIDPPYDNQAGRAYRYKLKHYRHLSHWCQQRQGQVMVCENAGATWLPFRDFRKQQSTNCHRGDGVADWRGEVMDQQTNPATDDVILMNISIMHRKAKGTNTAQSTMVAAKARLRLAMNDRVRKATSGTYNDWCKEVTPQWQWDAEHIEYIHSYLDQVTQGTVRKLMVNLPPRHSKTESITVHYAAYRLELNPATTILVVCHTQGLATKLSRKIRKLVDGRVELSKAKRSASEWETRAGGGVKAVGVMGVGGGLGFDVIICDDIIKSRKEANSPAFRSRINDAYKDDISTRLNPNGAMLMPFTRWHLQDIGGYILDSEDGPNWEVIKLPALAEANDPLHRPEGKALWPERWDEAYLAERKQIMGPSFHPLYQQNPLLGGGDLFKAFWFADAIIPALPANCTYVRAWDKAATSGGTGAETAGVLMARTAEGQFIVCDVIHGRWSVAEREATIKRTADADGYETSIWIEQEPGSGGKESAQSSVMNLSGYNVHTQVMSGEGDKRTRAEPMAAQAEVGNVKILQDTPIHKWNQVWIGQAADFPQGNLKDVIDASSMAFNKLALKPPPGKPAVSDPRRTLDGAYSSYAETRTIWDR